MFYEGSFGAGNDNASFTSGSSSGSSDAGSRGGSARAPAVAPPEPESPTTSGRLLRALDILVALVALVFFLPLMIAVAAAVRLSGPGPILFAHQRIGRGGRRFKCLKFRTMATDAQERLAELLANDPAAAAEWRATHKLRDDPRITPIGRFLRKSSLDELPQIVNVLRGEMSVVGPRPIVDDEVARYGRHFGAYCRVRPGITGLWQVSGRSCLSYRRRVALDVLYARTVSVGLNLRIIAVTVPSVLAARGSC